jgi:ATP-binding cassette subfamily B protein
MYAAFAAAGLGQLSEVWGAVSAASGAAERLFEILNVEPEITAPASPRALPAPSRGDVSEAWSALACNSALNHRGRGHQ